MRTWSRASENVYTEYVSYQLCHAHEPKDTSKPLPYLRYVNKSPTKNSKRALHELTFAGYGLENPWLKRAYAKAYDKFVDSAKQNLQLSMGANLAESKRTLEMIALRAEQLYKMARDLRAGRLPKRKRRSRKNWRRLAQRPGGWWLEYHFAWSPLLGEIATGLEMLSEPTWDIVPVQARGRETTVIDRSHPRDWRPAEIDRSSIEAYCAIRANVRVENKNAYLANRLGLINPAAVAWEVIPFSFAIDWFIPVSSFLNSYTDQVGWRADRLQVSLLDKCDSTWVIDNPYDSPENNIRLSHAVRHQRIIPSTLPIPGLFDRRGTGVRSLTRGATAIALLVGFLRKNP